MGTGTRTGTGTGTGMGMGKGEERSRQWEETETEMEFVCMTIDNRARSKTERCNRPQTKCKTRKGDATSFGSFRSLLFCFFSLGKRGEILLGCSVLCAPALLSLLWRKWRSMLTSERRGFDQKPGKTEKKKKKTCAIHQCLRIILNSDS
jgi:hypothetical protein